MTWEHLLGCIDSIALDSEILTIQMTDFKDKYKIKPRPFIDKPQINVNRIAFAESRIVMLQKGQKVILFKNPMPY